MLGTDPVVSGNVPFHPQHLNPLLSVNENINLHKYAVYQLLKHHGLKIEFLLFLNTRTSAWFSKMVELRKLRRDQLGSFKPLYLPSRIPTNEAKKVFCSKVVEEKIKNIKT